MTGVANHIALILEAAGVSRVSPRVFAHTVIAPKPAIQSFGGSFKSSSVT